MLYLDQPNVQIYYNRVLNCTIHTWKGYFLEEEYRSGMNRCLELMTETGARSLIVNVQAARHEYWLENGWTALEWFPGLTHTELQKLAVVVNTQQFSSANLFFYPVDNERFIVSRYFERLDDAQEWIAHHGM